MKKITINLVEEDYELLENKRADLNMNRSQYVKYILNDCKEIRPACIINDKLLEAINNLSCVIKVVAMDEGIKEEDRMLLMSGLEKLKDNLT